MKKKMVAMIMALCVMATGLVGCGNGAADGENTDAAKGNTQELSGTLTLAGSTSMEKLCEALSESFMEANPNVTVTVE